MRYKLPIFFSAAFIILVSPETSSGYVGETHSVHLSFDKHPIRRGADSGGSSRRHGIEGDRRGRAGLEGAKKPSQAQIQRKQKTKKITLIFPPNCGSKTASAFRDRLLKMTNPSERFTVELWGNQRVYRVHDSIHYLLRSNRTAYVTLFWIGPRGTLFIPFSNLHVEANRDHRINPRNIIVPPVGKEKWRAIATLEPHALPCRGNSAAFNRAMNRIKRRGPYAVAQWDVLSKLKKGRRLRLRRK